MNTEHVEFWNRTLAGGVNASNELVHELIWARKSSTPIVVTEAHDDQVEALAKSLSDKGEFGHSRAILALLDEPKKDTAKK